jgi:amino acid adenylation domain-containing protein/thioester reductase-like protein
MDQLAERLKNLSPLQRAVVALKETQARLDALERSQAEPIAIVGMACRFPGGVVDPRSFWQLLTGGVDAIRETPADRWDVERFYDPDPAAPGKMCSRWGGYLDHVDLFDNHFFGISDREALRIDPQQRLLLELAWEALEDACLPPSSLRGTKAGAFVGISVSEYGIMLSTDVGQTDSHAASGTSLCLAANRLSYVLGLQGPSMALDTACSSSLVAVHLACQNIRQGECEIALAGGTNLLLSPLGTINLTKAGFCARDGRVRAFDADASGYVRSEGAGIVVLKPLAAALKNRDPIYAVIRGSAVNQNGASNGLTAPSRAAQEQVLRDAYARAKVSPGQVQYVETQGTGTRLGDTIEALALGAVLAAGRQAGSRCALGAVKTNLGHMETASGVASLMKAALALKHRQLPPNLHFRVPNPDIPFDQLPLRVLQKLESWPDEAQPRLAGVSAFGFGGSNAHIVLEEAPAVAEATPIPRTNGTQSVQVASSPDAACILPLSARTEKALRELAQRYVAFLAEEPPSWSDVCYTAAARRDHHDCRLAVLASSADEARQLLQGYLAGISGAGIYAGRKPYGRNLSIGFVYDAGEETVQPSRARLARSLPGFASRITADVKSIEGGNGRYHAEPHLALQLALTDWWRTAGVTPDVVVGTGVGELAAACAAGILTAEEALGLVAGSHASGNGSTPQSRVARLPFLSSLDGRPHLGPDLKAEHWQACLGQPAKMEIARKALAERKVDICLLMGEADPAGLTGQVAPILESSLATVARLYAAGADLTWTVLSPASGQCVRLPSYPWQKQRHWAPQSQWNALPPAPPNVEAPSLRSSRPDLITPYVAPQPGLETVLAEIWEEILQVDHIGVHDDFFALGGHSLLATQVVSRIAGRVQADLSLREMFQSPTIAQLVQRVEAANAEGQRAVGPPILPAPRDGQMLPSFTQEALWFLDQLERGRATYTIYSPLRIKGQLDVATAERAVNEIVRRHESLRTRFPESDGRPIQLIEPAQSRPLPLVDLSLLPEDQRESRLREWIAEEMERPIDLQKGPLMRITLLRLSDDDHVAMVSAHHLIYDGWSMAVLQRELAALYGAYSAGKESPLPELPIQYADFAAWQRQWLQGEQLQRLKDYWVQKLTGVAPVEIPLDHPRPSIRTTRGASRAFDLAPETGKALLEFCRREGVTPFMVLLAAFDVLLHRYSGQEDITVGSPVANRARPETEALIGYFVNVVVLRNDLSGDPTFRELLRRVRQATLDAYDHQEMTLDQVVAAVNPVRDMSRHPLFQVMFALHNFEQPRLDSFGLTMTGLENGPPMRTSFFDLTLAFWQNGAELRGEWNFSTDLFRTETIDRMAGHYQVLLAAALTQPDRSLGDLPLLGEDERQQLLVEWNQTSVDYPREACIHGLFASRAAQTPEALAVVLGDQRWTYRQLNERSSELARYLLRRGVGPETRVGICMDRSPQLLAAVLGVLKAGGAYVPLDPAYTSAAEERLKYVLQDAQVALLLAAPELSASLAAYHENLVVLDGEALPTGSADFFPEEPSDLLSGTATSQNLAYILYTSGSTGRPKGVMVTHRNLVNAYCGWLREYGLENDVRSHLQMASFGFDVFGGDMVRALCSGGKLVICPKEILLDPPRLLELIRREKIDIGEFVPVVMRNLVQYLDDTQQTLDSMRLVVVGSDAWYVAEHKRTLRLLGTKTRLINSYGLTETTIDSSFFEGDASSLPDAALVPIGRPFANVRLYVLDRRMQPTPIGVPGELYIGGDGVSRGYVDGNLNAQRFVADSFLPGSPNHSALAVQARNRLCRTGDRARFRSDGQIEFLGRADNQIKIRGFRVEPGEIEEILGGHPALGQAAVAARERTPGDLRLIAYVVGKAGAEPDVNEIKQFLAQRVPDYMIPSAFVALSALPTTASGKVDRKALPAPDWTSAAARVEYVAPRTGTEEQLARIWSEVLQLDRVGVHDNFFELGGNSLLALRLVARVRAALSLDLPLVTLFTAPTVAGLATAVEKIQAEPGAESDLASEPIDWDAEVKLDPDIRVTADLLTPATSPARVLLTGATGFLGAYLLRELLRKTSASVYCLVRAKTVEEAHKRIADNLKQYELRLPQAAGRLIPVCGDLASPRLGLTAEEFASLAASVDAIYHNGAYVNFVYPYPSLRPANVVGTIEVLRLATQVKVKPLHFVSTVSVFDSPHYGAMGTIDEDQPLAELASLQGGYAQSKCVAEKLVRAAGERGLPVTVYRPGRVTADSETGAESLADYTTLLLRLCIEMKTAPATDDRVDMTPVDYVAQAIVGLAMRPESVGKTFHLMNPQPVPVRDVYRAIRASGFELQEVPPDVWRTSAIRWGTHSQDASFMAFSHWLMLMTPSAATTPGVPAVSPPPLTVASRQSQKVAEAAGVICPLLDVRRLKKQVQFLVRNKLCAAPPKSPVEKHLSLMPLRAAGTARPLFCIHGLGGHVVGLLPLAQSLTGGRPVYALQALGLEPGQEPQDQIEEMADSYLREIRTVQGDGPYLLCGWSMGGQIAIEAAQQLRAAGQEVALVAMFDTYLSVHEFQDDVDDRTVLQWIATQLDLPIESIKNRSLEVQWDRIAELADQASVVGIEDIRRLAAACQAHLRALSRYEIQPYAGRCVLFPAASGRAALNPRWKTICPQLGIEPVPGDHYGILREPHVRSLAEGLDRWLRDVDDLPGDRRGTTQS